MTVAGKGCPKRRFMIELKAVKCNVEEQETTIQISRTDGVIHLYTSDNTRISKMQKLLNAKGTEWKLDKAAYNKDGEPTGYFFSCNNKKMLSLRAKPAERSPMSEEQKAALAERFVKTRSEN